MLYATERTHAVWKHLIRCVPHIQGASAQVKIAPRGVTGTYIPTINSINTRVYTSIQFYSTWRTWTLFFFELRV